MAARESAGNRTVDRDLAQRLADRVRVARTAAGLSQEALAQAAGISTLQIVRIEGAHANPTLATLTGIADALHLDVVDLLQA